MIDYDALLVSALKKVLPTHYELALTGKEQTPCISYQERNNYDDVTGNTLGYSKISYTIKVWGREVAELKKYALRIDAVLRTLGFKRLDLQSLADPNSTMIQLIMTYEAIGLEKY